MKMPFLFVRWERLKDNASEAKQAYVVMLASHYDYKRTSVAWMDDPILGDDGDGINNMVLAPDVDICEEHWVFDGPNAVENELAAFRKLKELWVSIDIPEF
jgi:hypothetical protein